ncbi:MAG TPA: DUF1360 domain-containing protein [Candidatus Paceibacterota bacterium]|nr:DUF1360 domain-containing protein [Candidatus Paceibacterota bacterium]
MAQYEYQRDHALWNPLALIFFLALMIGAFWYLDGFRGFLHDLYSLDFLSLTVLSLATLRIIRLFTYDKIMQFFRDFFLDEGKKPEGGIRRLGAELIECIWCTGMWGALVALFFWYWSPFGTFLVYLLAISAAGSLLQNFSQLLARAGSGASK